MARPSITLPDQLAEPMFCKEPDDFPLMVLQISKSILSGLDENPDDFLEFLTLSFKIICHEYMACVLSGTVEPYQFDTEFRNKEYDAFRRVIMDAKELAIKAGIPMVEKDGKFIIDVDELSKRARIIRRKRGES